MWHCPPYSTCKEKETDRRAAGRVSAHANEAQAGGATSVGGQAVAVTAGGAHPLHSHEGVGPQAGAAHYGEVRPLPAISLLRSGEGRAGGQGGSSGQGVSAAAEAAAGYATTNETRAANCAGASRSCRSEAVMEARLLALDFTHRVLQQASRHYPARAGCQALRCVPADEGVGAAKLETDQTDSGTSSCAQWQREK